MIGRKAGKMEPNYIKVRYSEGETGWAEDLGDGTIKIANCPLTPSLGLGDVCSTFDGFDGWKTVDKVLTQRYPHRMKLWYKNISDIEALNEACTEKDWALEGGIPIKDGRDGFATVNYDGKETDLDDLIRLLNLQDNVRLSS